MLGNEKAREAKVQVGFRVRQSLADYIEKRTDGGAHGAGTRLIEDALGLHKSLFEKLASHKQQLARFAVDNGFDLHEQEAEVYARLILLGLAKTEATSRK